MSDSVRPHRRQLTRLPCPWDSPGKNTGVGCHFLLQCMQVKSKSEVAQSSGTLWDPMDCSLPGSTIHRTFQAKVLEWAAIAFSIWSILGISKLGSESGYDYFWFCGLCDLCYSYSTLPLYLMKASIDSIEKDECRICSNKILFTKL